MGGLRSIASDSVERVSLLPVPTCLQHWVQRCGRRWTFLFLCPQHHSAGMGLPETWRSLGCSHGDGHIHRYICLSACLSSHPASEQLRSPQTLGRGVGPTVRNSIKCQDLAFWSEFCALSRGHSHAGGHLQLTGAGVSTVSCNSLAQRLFLGAAWCLREQSPGWTCQGGLQAVRPFPGLLDLPSTPSTQSLASPTGRPPRGHRRKCLKGLHSFLIS